MVGVKRFLTAAEQKRVKMRTWKETKAEEGSYNSHQISICGGIEIAGHTKYGMPFFI